MNSVMNQYKVTHDAELRHEEVVKAIRSLEQKMNEMSDKLDAILDFVNKPRKAKAE